MKKTIVTKLAILLAVMQFMSCSSPSSGTDTKNESSTTGTNGGTQQNSSQGYIGTKEPSVAKEVGDIVFNDGSAMPYTIFMALDESEKNTKKNSAIAVIFYKGTDLNNDVNGVPDTTTSRTLGVGLKHNRNGLAWCRWSSDTDCANAYDKNIEEIQCNNVNNNNEEMIFTGDKNGKDNFSQIAAFLSTTQGTNDDTNIAENYPAFYFAKNYARQVGSNIFIGSELSTGWYIPSRAEFFQIFKCRKYKNNGFDLDNISEILGGDKFDRGIYWTATQYSTVGPYAYSCGFHIPSPQGDYYNIKWSENFVCSIREFN